LKCDADSQQANRLRLALSISNAKRKSKCNADSQQPKSTLQSFINVKRDAEVEIGCQQTWVQTLTVLQNDGGVKLSTQLEGR
jgi:hypothetical protein